MPQLDASTFPSQLFWLTVSFIVLYILLARFLLPRVQSVLVGRERIIKGDIEQAERMKSDALAARENYEKALAGARAKSQAMLIEAQNAVAARNAKGQAELDRALEKQLLDAEAAIYAARQGVMNKLSPVSSELASLIVEVLVHHKPSAKELGAAMSDLAKERMI